MSFRPSRRFLIGSILTAIPTLYFGHSAWRLSADPLNEKDCGPQAPAPKQSLLKKLSDKLPWSKKGGTVNDVSCLSRTPVAGVIAVKSESDIKNTLLFAKDHNLAVSMAGARHSMGGHAFAPEGIVLDMTKYNAITLNKETKTIRVESGATWHDIQNKIHPNFAVKAMQSSDVFTVGGSISVNAHGMDHKAGALERSIRSMRVMLHDGTVQTVSRDENADLYKHVVGGYGLFGVILDVELDVTDNVILHSTRKIIPHSSFPEVFAKEIEPNDTVELFYGHLSTAPGSFLKECILYSYEKVPSGNEALPPLGEVSSVKLRRFIFNLAKQGSFFQKLKWFAEKKLEPMAESCTIKRADAQSQGEICLVSRNEPMHDSVPYLFNRLNEETDILHEYFIPRDKLVAFIDGMREIMQQEGTTLLNASIRVAHKELMALNYSPIDTFSVVLYINQTTDQAGNEKMAKLTSSLIDLSTQLEGRFFLPYQLHYTPEQLKKSYPEIGDFFTKKREIDPSTRFTNRWYQKYGTTV